LQAINLPPFHLTMSSFKPEAMTEFGWMQSPAKAQMTGFSVFRSRPSREATRWDDALGWFCRRWL